MTFITIDPSSNLLLARGARDYEYNALGQRVLKTLHQNNGGTAEQHQVFVFHYDQQGRLIQNGIYRPTATGVRHMRDRHFI